MEGDPQIIKETIWYEWFDAAEEYIFSSDTFYILVMITKYVLQDFNSFKTHDVVVETDIQNLYFQGKYRLFPYPFICDKCIRKRTITDKELRTWVAVDIMCKCGGVMRNDPTEADKFNDYDKLLSRKGFLCHM